MPLLAIPDHRVRFPSPSASIREDGGIEAIEHPLMVSKPTKMSSYFVLVFAHQQTRRINADASCGSNQGPGINTTNQSGGIGTQDYVDEMQDNVDETLKPKKYHIIYFDSDHLTRYRLAFCRVT